MNFLNQQNKRLILVLAFIVGLAVLIILPTKADALPTNAITLLYFRGIGMDNAIKIEWGTATEFETAGFKIKRANSQSGPYSNLDDIGFIPGEGNGIAGADYTVTDTLNINNGQTYWYILVEIESDGDENETDPISVVGGVPTATPTASATATNPPNDNQSTPTNTPTPSRTPTATATNQSSNSTTTPAPTSTQSTNSAGTTGSTTQTTATQVSSTTGGTTNSSSSTSSTGNVAEASSPTDPYPVGTPSPTFIPNPNETIEPEELVPGEGYPAGVNPDESYPAGTTESGAPDEQVTPFDPQIGDGTVNPLSTQPPLEPDTAENQQSGSSTLFLWVGFTAALLIFVGGIVGSIFLFTRRSNQK